MNQKDFLHISIIVLVLMKIFDIKIFKYQDKFMYIVILFYFVTQMNPKKIESFDGSSIAWDREAFENLNRIVKALAGDGNLVVPGNLIVKGHTTLENYLKFQTNNHKFTLRINNGKFVIGADNPKSNVNVEFRTNCSLLNGKGFDFRGKSYIKFGDLGGAKGKIGAFGSNGLDIIHDTVNVSNNLVVYDTGYIKNLIPENIKSSTSNEKWENGNRDPVTIHCPILFKKTVVMKWDVFVRNLIPQVIKSSTSDEKWENGNRDPVTIECPINCDKKIFAKEVDIDTLYGHAYGGDNIFRVVGTPQHEPKDEIYMTFKGVKDNMYDVKIMREGGKLRGNFPGRGNRRDLAVY